MLSADLPVIAVNDWLAVRDVLTGAEVGQLKVLLAAGLGTQIYRLTMMPDIVTIPTPMQSPHQFHEKSHEPHEVEKKDLFSEQIVTASKSVEDSAPASTETPQLRNETIDVTGHVENDVFEQEVSTFSEHHQRPQFWQPPEFEVVEDATWSYVAQKIGDLEHMTDGLKCKLYEEAEKAEATLASKRSLAASPPSAVHYDGLSGDAMEQNMRNEDESEDPAASLAYLKNKLQSRLCLMQEAAMELAKASNVLIQYDDQGEIVADKDGDDTFTVVSATDDNEDSTKEDLRPRLAPEGCNPSERDLMISHQKQE